VSLGKLLMVGLLAGAIAAFSVSADDPTVSRFDSGAARAEARQATGDAAPLQGPAKR
jgi:hypothetical protein